MTDKEVDATTEPGDETIEFAAEPENQAETPQSTASKSVPGWVLPVAVGAAGLVLSVATGIGGFLAGVKISDGFDQARGLGHVLSDEFDGPSRSFRGERDADRGGEGRGFGKGGARDGGDSERGTGDRGHGHGPGRGEGFAEGTPQGPSNGSLAG